MEVSFAFPGWNFWDIYNMPTHWRKYCIKYFNEKQKKLSKNDKDGAEPLSQKDKERIRSQSKQLTPTLANSAYRK